MISHVNSSTESQTFLQTLDEASRDLFASRDLLKQLTLRDIRIRYKQAVMGLGWAVFMPVLIVTSGLIVRYVMATLSGTTLERDSIATMTVKSLPWAFFVGATGFAVNSLTANAHLITKTYFPREVLPLAAILAQGFDTAVGSVAVGIVLPFLGVELHWSQLWVPLLVFLLVTFTCTIALAFSMANLFFRDVKYIVQVVLTFGIFFTPVLFEPAMLGPRGAKIIMLNPLSPLMEGFRLAVVEGHNLLDSQLSTVSGQPCLIWSPWFLAVTGFWCTFGLVASIVLFHRAQYRFAEMA